MRVSQIYKKLDPGQQILPKNTDYHEITKRQISYLK